MMTEELVPTAVSRSARQKLQEATKQGQSWGTELQVTKDSQAVLARRLEVSARSAGREA